MRTVYEKITNIRGNLITVHAEGVGLGELAKIDLRDGRQAFASVLRIDNDKVALQVFQSTRGISTGDKVTFLGRQMQAIFCDQILGRRFNGFGTPIDNGPEVVGEAVELAGPTFNPVRRVSPHQMVRTNIPMIDVFNCLVKSQKIPIFSIPGEPYNELLMRIANQTDSDVVIIGGMGLTFTEYQAFIDNAEHAGTMNKTVMFTHRATDPAVECVLVPDMALACAEKFAMRDQNVLVLLTDMSAFADAIKEISITMDQVPSNRGYPGSLYSDLALRYEKAVATDTSGSITIVAVTTMPGNDVTHPIPDNTGYITEGQFYLYGGRIDPFGSLSRLKQLVIGKVTREDHSDLANAMVRLYAEAQKAVERRAMGFRLSKWDEKLLHFSNLFETRMMDLHVNLPLEEALDRGWELLEECFKREEVGIKQSILNKYWPDMEVESPESDREFSSL
jgi:V/A-type H+/Na+-transporting ATPase subunit B